MENDTQQEEQTQQTDEQNVQPDGEQGHDKTAAQSVELSEANGAASSGATSSVEILLDMTIPVTVNIGDTNLTVKDILQLGQGSVISLDKPLDSPVELYLKSTKFATGQVVVVDNKFAVKIDQILNVPKA